MSAMTTETEAATLPSPAATAESVEPATATAAIAPPPFSWADWLLGVLRHEPAHALTLFYLGVSALGLWASYWFFASFGIPVMDYMDPSDYITVGLRDPIYLLIVALAMVLMLALNFHQYAQEKGPAYYGQMRGRWWGRLLLPVPYREKTQGLLQRLFGWSGFSFPTGILVSVVWATLWLTVAYVQHKAEAVRDGGGHAVRVTLAHTHEAQPGTARLLGTIGDFVFLYWPEQKRAEAIAVEEVGRLQSLPAARANAKPVPAAAQAPTPATSARPPAAKPVATKPAH